MKEYHINSLKEVSFTKLTCFQEKVKDCYKYDILVIDEGYRGSRFFDKPKFGFVFERVDKGFAKQNTLTMSQFKRQVIYMDLLTGIYDGVENVDCSYEIPNDKQIFLRAQIAEDVNDSQYDGAHCSLVLRLVAVRCVKRE